MSERSWRLSSPPLRRLRHWAHVIRRDALAVYLAARDARVPWYAKVLAAVTAAYAFSPVDLIPDFIPVLGYLDDLLLVPLGILIVVRLIPPGVMAELRQRADEMVERPVSRTAAFAIGLIWLLVLGTALWFGWTYLTESPG